LLTICCLSRVSADFGQYDANVQFLDYQHYQSYITFTEYAGADTISGGSDDDFIIGQEVRRRLVLLG
jgi:hypothetical protein